MGKDGYRIPLVNGLQPEQVLRFQEQNLDLPGASVDMDILRFYPHGMLASHTLGYTQPITEDEYEVLIDKGYKIRDRIGRIGVEAAYESHLRGKWGGQMLEVNANGEVQRYLGDRPSKAGKDLTLTIDLDLQRAAEKALADKRGGAIVAMNPTTGAILAMASKPNFDPNFFSKLITTQQEYDALFQSPSKPLFSRAMNAYNPGSTWKVVTGMAGMESGNIQLAPNCRPWAASPMAATASRITTAPVLAPSATKMRCASPATPFSIKWVWVWARVSSTKQPNSWVLMAPVGLRSVTRRATA